MEYSSKNNINASSDGIIIGIDAVNILQGGGRTHLVELIRNLNYAAFNISKIVVWGSSDTLSKLGNHSWLKKVEHPKLEKGLLNRSLWQARSLSEAAKAERCDVLFIPGGNYMGNFTPVITMSQNMLPFEFNEIFRYGFSLMTAKLLILRYFQKRSIRNADGVIFLTEYAKNKITKTIGPIHGNTTIIPHGISSRFYFKPRVQRDASEFNRTSPCKILYVSIIDVYKHQWHVADAVSRLKDKGFPVCLELVGPPGRGISRLENTLARFDPKEEFIKYVGEVPYEQLESYYKNADMAVFASSCENMPIILLEAMAAGLPIACSYRGPMPEILGEAGKYFNPEDPESIACALTELFKSQELRKKISNISFEKAKMFSWGRCARETFTFINEIANTEK